MMIILNVFVDVVAGKEDEFLARTKPLIEATRKEAGCQFYQLFRDGSQFAFIEHWQDKAALDEHSTSAHFKTFADGLDKLLNQPLQIKSYKK